MKLDLFLAIFIFMAAPVLLYGMMCYLPATDINFFFISMASVVIYGGSYLFYYNYKTKKKAHEKTF
jgi:hypothetical protein